MELFCEGIDFLTSYIKRVFNFTYFFHQSFKIWHMTTRNHQDKFVFEEMFVE